MQQKNREINFYTGYEKSLKQAAEGGKKGIVTWLPLAALLLILILVALNLTFKNRAKQAELARIQQSVDAMQTEYNEVVQLGSDRDQLADIDLNLSLTLALAEAYPALNQALFDSIERCTVNEFFITTYRFDESTGTIELDAAAASVNLVPNLVERLRDTGLFSAVQYTGYTSNSDSLYYCTVGCTLAQ